MYVKVKKRKEKRNQETVRVKNRKGDFVKNLIPVLAF